MERSCAQKEKEKVGSTGRYPTAPLFSVLCFVFHELVPFTFSASPAGTHEAEGAVFVLGSSLIFPYSSVKPRAPSRSSACRTTRRRIEKRKTEERQQLTKSIKRKTLGTRKREKKRRSGSAKETEVAKVRERRWTLSITWSTDRTAAILDSRHVFRQP